MILSRLTLVVPDGDGTLPVPSGMRLAWPYGSDVVIPVALVHQDGTAYDLTVDHECVLPFRKLVNDPAPLVALSLEVTDAAAGLGQFTLARALAPRLPVGDYCWGVQFRDLEEDVEDSVLLGGMATVLYRPGAVDETTP